MKHSKHRFIAVRLRQCNPGLFLAAATRWIIRLMQDIRELTRQASIYTLQAPRVAKRYRCCFPYSYRPSEGKTIRHPTCKTTMSLYPANAKWWRVYFRSIYQMKAASGGRREEYMLLVLESYIVDGQRSAPSLSRLRFWIKRQRCIGKDERPAADVHRAWRCSPYGVPSIP